MASISQSPGAVCTAGTGQVAGADSWDVFHFSGRYPYFRYRPFSSVTVRISVIPLPRAQNRRLAACGKRTLANPLVISHQADDGALDLEGVQFDESGFIIGVSGAQFPFSIGEVDVFHGDCVIE
jgi:hypothetical protein